MSAPNLERRDGAPDQISLREILTIVFKRRRLISVFAISVVAVVVSTLLVLPRSYEVTATLLVNRSRAEIQMAPTDRSELIVSGSEQDLNAEIEVLHSRSLFEEVTEIVAPFEKDLKRDSKMDRLLESMWALIDRSGGADNQALLVELQQDIQTYAIPQSNAISIRYKTRHPEWATRVVESLIERYMERRTEAFQSSQAVAFFEEQMLDSEQKLASFEGQIEGFTAGSSMTVMRGPQGTDSLGAQKSLAMERLSRLRADLGSAKVSLREHEEKAASLRLLLASEPERIATASRNNITPETEEIEVALAELRLRRDELLQDFKLDSRYVRDIETQISLAEARLEGANDASSGVNRTESNPIYLQLRGELMRAETQAEGIRARVGSLSGQVASSQRELESLNASAFELDAMRRQALAAEDDYLLYRKKYEEARISSAMDRERIINVTVAQPALMPLRPIRRGLVKKSLLALFVGVFGGFAIAFVFDQYIDRTLTTAGDVEKSLQVPHLASIPFDVRTG